VQANRGVPAGCKSCVRGSHSPDRTGVSLPYIGDCSNGVTIASSLLEVQTGSLFFQPSSTSMPVRSIVKLGGRKRSGRGESLTYHART
jgi:hypothetical protein